MKHCRAVQLRTDLHFRRCFAVLGILSDVSKTFRNFAQNHEGCCGKLSACGLEIVVGVALDSLLRVGRVGCIRFFNVLYLIIVNVWLVSYSEQYLGIYFLPR